MKITSKPPRIEWRILETELCSEGHRPALTIGQPGKDNVVYRRADTITLLDRHFEAHPEEIYCRPQEAIVPS